MGRKTWTSNEYDEWTNLYLYWLLERHPERLSDAGRKKAQEYRSFLFEVLHGRDKVQR